jgi:S-adenosylmethionine synthetase
VVAAGLADQCEVQLSYSVGPVQSVGIRVETFESGKVRDDELTKLVATYGHMGRTDLDLPWEKIEEAAPLRALAAAPVHR